MPNVLVPVAAGAEFLVHDSDLDQPGMGAAFKALCDLKVIAVEETDVRPPLH